jgi:hypothetical protein
MHDVLLETTLRDTIQHLDIFYLRTKVPGRGTQYIARASKILSEHTYDSNLLRGFTRQNNMAFLRYPSVVSGSNDTTENSLLRVGSLVLASYEKPTMDIDPANRVPFQIQLLKGHGTLLHGDEFRLYGMEPGLWNERRYLSPKNREGTLSYGDTRNEVVYRGAAVDSGSHFSTVWWIPSGESGGVAHLEGTPVCRATWHRILQVGRQAALVVLDGELSTMTADNSETDETWHFEKIALSTSNVF